MTGLNNDKFNLINQKIFIQIKVKRVYTVSTMNHLKQKKKKRKNYEVLKPVIITYTGSATEVEYLLFTQKIRYYRSCQLH